MGPALLELAKKFTRKKNEAVQNSTCCSHLSPAILTNRRRRLTNDILAGMNLISFEDRDFCYNTRNPVISDSTESDPLEILRSYQGILFIAVFDNKLL